MIWETLRVQSQWNLSKNSFSSSVGRTAKENASTTTMIRSNHSARTSSEPRSKLGSVIVKWHQRQDVMESLQCDVHQAGPSKCFMLRWRLRIQSDYVRTVCYGRVSGPEVRKKTRGGRFLFFLYAPIYNAEKTVTINTEPDNIRWTAIHLADF